MPWSLLLMALVASLQYRAPDARVELIHSEGYSASGLFLEKAEVHARPAEISGALARLSPGAQLVIDDGIFRDVDVTIKATGTSERPVLVRPQTLGGVRFVGRTRIRVVGANVIVLGLSIADGSYAHTATVLSIGTSQQACDHCVVMQLQMSGLSAIPGKRVQFLSVRGRDVTIAYSRFARAVSPGHFIMDSTPTEGAMPARLHVLHNAFVERGAQTNENGYELLQLGESTVQSQSMYGRLEDNLFADSAVPPADGELVAIKSSDWVIQHNTFRNTVGELSLRSTNRCLVVANVFGGGGQASASGIRVHGADHFIVNNSFYRNANPKPAGVDDRPYAYSIVVPAGTVEAVADGEIGVPVAKNVIIAGNSFINGSYNIQLGAFFPKYPLMPRGVVVANNLLRTSQTRPLFVLPRGYEARYLSGNTIANNLLSAPITGLEGWLPAHANPRRDLVRLDVVDGVELWHGQAQGGPMAPASAVP